MNRDKKKDMLALNLVPVRFDDAEVHVGILDYKEDDKDQLHNLRAAHNRSHVFLRDGSEILSVPFTPDAKGVGDRFKTIQLKDHLRLCAALVRNALLNYLYGLGRPLYGYRPLRFAATGQKNNLLATALPEQLTCPDWLSVRPLHVADVRVFYFDRRPPFVGVAFDIRTTRRISLSCRELIADNFSPLGLYVGQLVPLPDARIEPRLELLGRIENIEGELLMLTDARPEKIRVNAGNVVLEPGRVAFDRCLSHVFAEQAERVRAALERSLVAIHTGPSRLERLREVAQYLAKTHLELIPGVPFKIGSLLSSDSKTFPPLETASKPIYVFDSTGARTDTWHDRGLNRYGPYSSQTFDKNRPRICVVCQATNKGQVEQFLHKFLHGITIPVNRQSPFRNRKAPFEKGFIRKYQLEKMLRQSFSAPIMIPLVHTNEPCRKPSRGKRTITPDGTLPLSRSKRIFIISTGKPIRTL
jgi:hypothetical protein